MSKVVVFGTGAFGEAVRFYLDRDSDHRVVAFTAHEGHLARPEHAGLPAVPFETVEAVYPPSEYKMFVAVGYRKVNALRAAVYEQAKAKGYELVSYVSSKCSHWGDTAIGDNCFIFEDNTIQPFVTIGNDVVLWSGNHIGHGAAIGDHCFISSHVVLSACVKVGPYSFLGVNATVRDSVRIGRSCVIGAGALILRHCRDKEVYVARGTPRDTRTSDEIIF
jgi:sugar O-acyltransferase (sialic acid O-acetyltransferase NeuD family)